MCVSNAAAGNAQTNAMLKPNIPLSVPYYRNIISLSHLIEKLIAVMTLLKSIHCPLILDVAPLKAAFDSLDEWGGESFLELREVVGIDLLGETKRSINNSRIDREEVLRDAAGTWVLRVESADTDLRVALEVLLEMDAALGEDGALELGQGSVELGGQRVLEHEASCDAPFSGDSEELRGARVDVRGVEPTSVEEKHCGRETEIGQYWEVRTIGKINLAA